MLTLALLFLAHFIADFLLQPRWMGTQKSSKLHVLFLHCMIQLLTVFAFLQFGAGTKLAAQAALANTVVHGVIDWYIWNVYKFSVVVRNPDTHPDELKKEWKYWDDHWFYATIGFDQMLHSLTLIAVYWYILK